jgi:hypothetical protein
MNRSAILWTCVLSVFLAGCYSHESVTIEAPAKPGADVSFRLHDGSRVLATTFQRVDSGYVVVGKLLHNDNKTSEPFSGFLPDEKIKEIVTNKFNPGMTALTVLLVIGCTAAFVAAANTFSHMRF